MDHLYLREIEAESEKIDDIVQNFPQVICVHVYKSVPNIDANGNQVGRNPCIEGMQLADTLAELIYQGSSSCEGEFVPPVIVLGADSRESFGGIPLSQTYMIMIKYALVVRGLNPETCCQFFNLEKLGFVPVDTRSEIIAHKAACEFLHEHGKTGRVLSFFRKFHEERINRLSNRMNFHPNTLTHEAVALKYFIPNDPFQLINLAKMFPKTRQSEAAEEFNLMIMTIDRGAWLLSLISRIPWIKRFLLTSAAGHP